MFLVQQLSVSGVAPPARKGHTAVVFDGKMIVFGGQTTKTPLNDLWVFNPSDNSWKLLDAQGTVSYLAVCLPQCDRRPCSTCVPRSLHASQLHVYIWRERHWRHGFERFIPLQPQVTRMGEDAHIRYSTPLRCFSLVLK